MLRLVVEIDVGITADVVDKIADMFDKATGSFDGLKPEQVDLNYIHALNESHLHEIRVVSILTKSEIVPISIVRQSSSRVTSPVSTARPINTATPNPIVNVAKYIQNALHKTHLLSRRHFHQQTTLKNRYLVNIAKVKSDNTLNTAKGKSVKSVVGKQRSNAVNSSTCWVWRPKTKGDPQAILRDTGIFDSGCLRHMTGNKSFLSDYQEYDRGFVAF
nr:hypothetical protein [Tanacetum cinerariifolium]